MSLLAKNFLMLEDATSATCSNWSAVRSALVADVLRRSGSLRVRLLVRGEIHGESMLPALWPGDVVEIESCSVEDIRPGEIVLALREDRVVLHRLAAPCTRNGFLLRGDSMTAPDAIFPPTAFWGRLVHVRSAGRTVPLPVPLRPWSRALGVLLRYCGIARRVALKIHSRQSSGTILVSGALADTQGPR